MYKRAVARIAAVVCSVCLVGCDFMPASSSPISAPVPAVSAVQAKQPVRVVETDGKRMTYSQATNTLTLQTGAWTVPALSQNAESVLRLVAKDEWLLTANLVVAKGSSLRIAGPQVAWLKLASTAQGFVWLKALGGGLQIESTKITSWDTDRNAVDDNSDDGRSFVLARNGARMNILNSEMSYLGYFANESYGVAWRNKDTGGQAMNSVFGYNFYGLYTHETSGLIFTGNEVHHSVRYGIDPHTRSNHLLIENNRSHHNGKQGIILAEDCSDSVIRNNTVFSNAMHGIVIYQRSNNNVVEGNVSYANTWQGININDSSNTVVRNNTVYGNGKAGIGVGENAQNTQIFSNTVNDNAEHGMYFYSGSTGSLMMNNLIHKNGLNGIYLKSDGNVIGAGNSIVENKVGVLQRVANPQDLSQVQGDIRNNTEQDTKLSSVDTEQGVTEVP